MGDRCNHVIGVWVGERCVVEHIVHVQLNSGHRDIGQRDAKRRNRVGYCSLVTDSRISVVIRWAPIRLCRIGMLSLLITSTFRRPSIRAVPFIVRSTEEGVTNDIVYPSPFGQRTRCPLHPRPRTENLSDRPPTDNAHIGVQVLKTHHFGTHRERTYGHI